LFLLDAHELEMYITNGQAKSTLISAMLQLQADTCIVLQFSFETSSGYFPEIWVETIARDQSHTNYSVYLFSRHPYVFQQNRYVEVSKDVYRWKMHAILDSGILTLHSIRTTNVSLCSTQGTISE